jgi:hypothetical protein
MIKLDYIGAFQSDLLKKSILEESLRERLSYYKKRNLLLDFWIVLTPDLLKNSNFQKRIDETNYDTELNPQKQRSYAFLMTSNPHFYSWLQLRLGSFEVVGKANLNPPDIASVNGIIGTLEKEEFENIIGCTKIGELYPKLENEIIVKEKRLIDKVFNNLIEPLRN